MEKEIKMYEEYNCQTPVVLIIFNRPSQTLQTFNAIRKVKPKKLYIIADGPRNEVKNDDEKVLLSREIVNHVDWQCELIKIFSESNLGCMKRFVTGMSDVFSIENSVIILEDDCVPSINFFKFMDWGLEFFKDIEQVGMISGSNLIADKFPIEYRNGYSQLINIWGWGTWKRTWEKYNPYLGILELNKEFKHNQNILNLSFLNKFYWKELIKHSIIMPSWDFVLQYTFFKNNLLSVFPIYNTVNNVGFDGNGTHTNTSAPRYVIDNKPKNDYDILSINPLCDITINEKRDVLLAKTIWSFSLYTSLRLKIMNIVRVFFY